MVVVASSLSPKQFSQFFLQILFFQKIYFNEATFSASFVIRKGYCSVLSYDGLTSYYFVQLCYKSRSLTQRLIVHPTRQNFFAIPKYRSFAAFLSPSVKEFLYRDQTLQLRLLFTLIALFSCCFVRFWEKESSCCCSSLKVPTKMGTR